MTIEELEKRISELESERSALLKALKTAKQKQRTIGRYLALDNRQYPESPDEKVALFLELFGARRDVFQMVHFRTTSLTRIFLLGVHSV